MCKGLRTLNEFTSDVCALLDSLPDCPDKCVVRDICNDGYLCGDPELFAEEVKKKYE